MSIVGTVWSPRGPSPLSTGSRDDNGLTTAIAVHPSDRQIVYIGTAGGGVWKSGDGGQTWRALFDRQDSLGIGEPLGLALDPNDADVIYVGTSGRSRVSPQRQAGLFKSVDGGASWIRLGSGYPAGNTGNASNFFSDSINAIIVEPSDSTVVYLASSTGVWRSVDSGQNWTLGTGSNGDARSLALDPTSPATGRILYAGISGQGVIQSTDGGQTWPTQVLNSATPAVAAALAAVPGTTINQVVLDLAPPTSPPAAGGIQVIYAAIAGAHPTATTFPDPVGLFISPDQGTTWTQQAATGMTSASTTTYSGYCMTLAVDPSSPGDGAGDILFYGTRDQARSTDSGASFTALSNIHADTHAWAFFSPPAPAPTIVFCGTDGGINRSDDGGVTWVTRNAGKLQTCLFYNLDIKPDATASASAGALQDNGLKLATAGPSWSPGRGGDGWDIVYSGTTPTRLLASTNSGAAPQTRVFLSDDDGATWSDVTPFPNTGTESGFFLSNLAADPNSADIFYAAGNVNLWQTQDAGATWRPLAATPAFFITATVAIAPTNSNSVVVANGSNVLVSTDALAAAPTFVDITRNLPGRTVLRAAFDPNDATVIYAVLGGFAGAGPAGHVFRTTVSATPWTDISPELDVPFGALALDGDDTPTTLYVGTDLGVLRSVDRGTTWTVLDDLHFPRAPVTDLVLGRGSSVLRAATYGRGVFEFVHPDWPSIAVNLEAGLDVNLEAGLDFGTTCAGDTTYLTLEIFNVGTSDLVITSVQRLMGSASFVVLSKPGTPLVIRSGEHVDFTISFTPTALGAPEKATIRIVSNDPDAPTVDLFATGLGGTPALETVIADNGDFGAVCLGSFVDRDLVLNNSGRCPLQIHLISSSSPAFEVPGVVSYPLVVSAGGSIAVPIRFRPMASGTISAVLQIDSNDPASPAIVDVSGTAPTPRLVVSIADQGAFPDTCLGDLSDGMLSLSNGGPCPLTITAITSSSGDFLVPETVSFPLVISPGGDLELMLRFQPTHLGTSGGTIILTTDDPTSPAVIQVNGFTPSGRLTVTGTTDFGPVLLGDHAQQTLSICNTGDCDLHVNRVAFRPPCPCDARRRSPCECGGCGRCNSGGGHGCGHHHCGEHAGDDHGDDHHGDRSRKQGDEHSRHDHGDHDDEHGDKYGSHKHHDGHSCRCDQKCLNFRIVTNPFPATVHPGACLGVLLEYVPTCDSAACCELVIESDDPDLPQRIVMVTGHLRRTLRSALKCWAAQELHEILEAGNC